MKISSLTRTVVKGTHAVICPDGFVNSNIPGWANCTATVIINEAMGAQFVQLLVTLHRDSKLTAKTRASQLFFYILEGSCTASVNGAGRTLTKGQFLYIPVEQEYVIDNAENGTQILLFQKTYEHLEGHEAPNVIFGDATTIKGKPFLDDPALHLQVLLPDDWPFDMAVNIFTFSPGGHLPFVETHVMEHGLMFLQGQGIYQLDGQWYPVKKDDSIWMAPYCSQWFTAIGKETAVYIYYKNVSRAGMG